MYFQNPVPENQEELRRYLDIELRNISDAINDGNYLFNVTGSAPTVNDDSTRGYEIFSKWVDTTTDDVYMCTNATPAAAVWRKISVDDAEAWHEVGAPGEPAFENSWVNQGGSLDTVGFYKDQFDIVWIKGRAASGTLDTNIFTLPEGYRPPLSQSFVGFDSSPNAVRFLVELDGAVKTYGATSNTWQSIWCSFRV